MRARAWVALVLVVWFVNAGFGRADEQAEAIKIVDAAIKAVGGEAKLAKLDAVTLKGKGAVLDDAAKEAPFTGEGTLRGLDRFRFDLDVTLRDEPVKVVFALDGKKGWRKVNDRVFETPNLAIPLLTSAFQAFRMTQMLMPLKGKDLKLSPLGEIKIDGRTVEGVKITRKGRPDMDLYFDKETHLPVKCGLPGKLPDEDQEQTFEWTFSDYKNMGGVKHPTKLVLNVGGKKRVELEVGEVKPEEKVDDHTFAKP
ncbi:MAG TPA: hypothetical protein VKE94_17725 [Gemmataceae bacterium]|nr:hypothetical protein [Gemmataceae bacterium]